MTEELYFEIFSSESGLFIRKIPCDKIDSYLDEIINDDEPIEFLEDFPEDHWDKKREVIGPENMPNNGCCDESREIILIKGKIVKPKKVKVVQKLRIE